jgi:phosphatidylethanolamine/phosphatidyl-N-methylethanolamine N-methyltransferase
MSGPGISQEQVIRAYDRYAPAYDWLFAAIYAHGVREMARAVEQCAPKRVLEIGVGTGLALPHYPANVQITAIDLSASMLARARKRASQLPDRPIQLMEMDGESLRFPDASFDCVTLPYVLSVTPNPDRLIAEARRVCRADGHLLILNHFSGAGIWRVFEAPLRALAARIGFRSDFSYSHHVERHDWRIISCKPVNLLGLSRLVLARNA